MNSTRGTTTWVALAALLIASIMIGGVIAYALEDLVPGPGLRGSILAETTVIIIVLFCVLVIIRQKRVREIEPEGLDNESGPEEPESP